MLAQLVVELRQARQIFRDDGVRVAVQAAAKRDGPAVERERSEMVAGTIAKSRESPQDPAVGHFRHLRIDVGDDVLTKPAGFVRAALPFAELRQTVRHRHEVWMG